VTTSRVAPEDPAALPPIVNVHHVRLPVSDVLKSRDWYIDTLGFEPLLVEEDDDRIVGVALRQGAVTLGLHQDPRRAAALRGFVAFALGVHDLRQWAERLTRRGVADVATRDSHLGRSLRLEDPDGIVIELHTIGEPSADDT